MFLPPMVRDMKIMFEVKNVNFVKYELICHFCCRSAQSSAWGKAVSWTNGFLERMPRTALLTRGRKNTTTIMFCAKPAQKRSAWRHRDSTLSNNTAQGKRMSPGTRIINSSFFWRSSRLPKNKRVLQARFSLLDRSCRTETKTLLRRPHQLYQQLNCTARGTKLQQPRCDRFWSVLRPIFQCPPATALPSFLLKCSALKRLETLV